MAFTRLVDAWNRERRTRTPMPWGRRRASMEVELGADMTPGREARWERLDLDPDEHATHEPDQHQPDQHQPDQHQPDQHQPDQHEREGSDQPASAPVMCPEATEHPDVTTGAAGRDPQFDPLTETPSQWRDRVETAGSAQPPQGPSTGSARPGRRRDSIHEAASGNPEHAPRAAERDREVDELAGPTDQQHQPAADCDEPPARWAQPEPEHEYDEHEYEYDDEPELEDAGL